MLDAELPLDLTAYESHEVLVKMVEGGHGVGERPGLEDSKRLAREALMHLDPAVRRFLNPQIYPVGIERGLAALRQRLAREERAHQR